MQPTLTININPLSSDKGYQIVTFTGDFDKAGYSDVRKQLDACVDEFKGTDLIFDFSSMKYINSEGIGYLVEVHTHLVHQQKRLVIVGANEHVKDVFETIGIKEMIPMFDKLEEFLNK
jgi:anti-anti-sigma factor